MADDEVTPMQLSLGMAPERPMRSVPRYFSQPWKWINTAASGKGWHLVLRNRGGDHVITWCGLGGRKVSSKAGEFVPCPDCQAKLP